MEKWKAICSWNGGNATLTKIVHAPDFGVERRDRLEEEVFSEVVHLNGYTPEDWNLVWERVNG